MAERRSPRMTLFTDLVESGFDVTLAANRSESDVALRVASKGFSSAQLELLAAKAADHGAHLIVDQRGIIEIRFD